MKDKNTKPINKAKQAWRQVEAVKPNPALKPLAEISDLASLTVPGTC